MGALCGSSSPNNQSLKSDLLLVPFANKRKTKQILCGFSFATAEDSRRPSVVTSKCPSGSGQLTVKQVRCPEKRVAASKAVSVHLTPLPPSLV